VAPPPPVRSGRHGERRERGGEERRERDGDACTDAAPEEIRDERRERARLPDDERERPQLERERGEEKEPRDTPEALDPRELVRVEVGLGRQLRELEGGNPRTPEKRAGGDPGRGQREAGDGLR
jgi:hypothetical protein